MGSAGSIKKSKVSPASTIEDDRKKELASVWLLSSSDNQSLQQTMNDVRTKIKLTTTHNDMTSCISYVRSLSNYNVILVVSSEFTSKILPNVCLFSNIVSFISFYPFTDSNPSSIPKQNHFASSNAQLIDIINDDMARISATEQSIKVTIHEETINRLLASFAVIPIYGNSKKFIVLPVNYSLSLREPKIQLIRNKMPEIFAKAIGNVNEKELNVDLHAELKFIVDERNNEIGMEVQKLDVIGHSLLKDIDLKNYLSTFLKPIKIHGPMNMISSLPMDMPDGKSQKTLHVRPHELSYAIYDHYIVVSTNIEFTVDPGHKNRN